MILYRWYKDCSFGNFKYSRVKSTYNTLTASGLKIITKEIVDFLNSLKSGEFDETLKAKRSKI
jgi:hypothetical protein